MSKRPQCALHATTRATRSTIEEFIEWLGDQGITLCTHEPTHFALNGGTYYQTMQRPEDLASDFVGIDRVELENERRALLDSLGEES